MRPAGRPSCRDNDRLVVIGRSHAPPLRFRGRRIAVTRREMPGLRLETALWSREAGGYVVSLVIEERRGATLRRRSGGAGVGSLADAMEFLETLELPRPDSGKRGRRRSAAAEAGRCLGFSREASLRAAFADTVGEALADWAMLDGTTRL